MDSTSPEIKESVPEIDIPDLDNLEPWLEKYITKPFPGFEDRTHPDGTPYSEDEATEASRDQLRSLAGDRHKILRYKNPIRIKNGLKPLSEKKHDEYLVEDFIAIALNANSK